MAAGQKKGGKKMERSGRFAARNAGNRPEKVARARKRHLKNALRSCGAKFAQQLRIYYLDHTPPPRKVKRG